MATLQKQKGKYWYLIESVRVDGKPRPKVLAYLGKADDILEKLNGKKPISSKSYEYGTIAVLDHFINKLEIYTLFDKFCRNKRGGISKRNGLTLGKTMACIIMQRALHPRSKRAFSCWSKKTFLPILYDFDHTKITSQHFWDMMDYVEDDHLKEIEETITKDIFNSMCSDLDLLLYDYTNFFTFIDTNNDRCKIAQRGKNKQKRDDLRQFSLALLVTRNFKIPIFSDIYAGNTADAKEFAATIPKIQDRLNLLSKSIEDITLVFDKGSNSKDNFKQIKKINYVASLSVYHDQKLKKVPFSDFEEILIECKGEEALLPVYRIKKEIWGDEKTVVMYKSDALYDGQMKGFNEDLFKTKLELENLKKSIRDGHYKKKNQKREWTLELIREKVESIVNKQFIRDVIKFEISEMKGHGYSLSYKVDSSKKHFLHERVFGKRILITSRHNWKSSEILNAYHGQADVEDAFRRLKNPFHNSVRPQYHWTDQKIKVHTFCSVLSLTVAQLIEKAAHDHGFEMTIHEIFDRLSEIRKVKYLHSKSKKNSYGVEYHLEEIEDKKTAALFKALMAT